MPINQINVSRVTKYGVIQVVRFQTVFVLQVAQNHCKIMMLQIASLFSFFIILIQTLNGVIDKHTKLAIFSFRLPSMAKKHFKQQKSFLEWDLI